jgi:hypothetical protein
MINIRKDLIEKELAEGITEKISFKTFKLTQRFIDWLFSKYSTHEFSEHFYDSEPDVPEEWESVEDRWDNSEFLKVWEKLVKEYEPRRITFNNWIDPFGDGIWGMDQGKVDEIARNALKEIMDMDVDLSERLYIGFGKDGYAFLYFYGRDFLKKDYWWVMGREPLFPKDEKESANSEE